MTAAASLLDSRGLLKPRLGLLPGQTPAPGPETADRHLRCPRDDTRSHHSAVVLDREQTVRRSRRWPVLKRRHLLPLQRSLHWAAASPDLKRTASQSVQPRLFPASC